MMNCFPAIFRPFASLVFLGFFAGGLEESEVVCVGDREANRWLQYDSNNLPLTEEQWDMQRYVEKTHWGYYTWPR